MVDGFLDTLQGRQCVWQEGIIIALQEGLIADCNISTFSLFRLLITQKQTYHRKQNNLFHLVTRISLDSAGKNKETLQVMAEKVDYQQQENAIPLPPPSKQ